MFTISDIFNKYRSIPLERVNEFLTRMSIGHKRTELRKIEFRFVDWSWDLFLDDNYFRMDLAFPISEGADNSKLFNVILGGHKFYNEIESKLQDSPIGSRNFDND